MFRCEHHMDYDTLLDYDTCSICTGADDSTLDDCIGGGRVISRVHPQVAGHPKSEPQYLLHMRSWLNGVERVTTVPSRLPDDCPIPATHEPVYIEAWQRRFPTNGYAIEVIDSADVQELRVREAVRDFGLLVADRDWQYAISIGIDWDGFTTGIVEPEPDHLAADGAGLRTRSDGAGNGIKLLDLRHPVRSLPARAIRPTDRVGIARWRGERGA